MGIAEAIDRFPYFRAFIRTCVSHRFSTPMGMDSQAKRDAASKDLLDRDILRDMTTM